MTTEQEQLQKEYIKLLEEQAMDTALRRQTELCFDPQGRVVIDVHLGDQARDRFSTQLRNKPSETTTVSLDIMTSPELKKAYMDQYNLDEAQLKQLEYFRGSIIPLQQEFHFHMALAARTYTKMNHQKFPENIMAQVHQKVMKRVYPHVKQEFKEALTKSTSNNGTIDDVKLIKLMDKSRQSLFPEAHVIFVEEVVHATKTHLTKDELKTLQVKHTAEVTTATANDLLHTDESLGQSTWISGSEVTAHDRGQGIAHLADRQIITIAHIDSSYEPRIQIRTPSLDIKEGIISTDQKKAGKAGITQKDAISDVADKLNHLSEKYTMADVIPPNFLGKKAFTYNLLTAINDRLEGGKNKQSQGATFILAGAHEYNVSQLKKPSPLFCFVQNLSVNGFGDALGYDGNDLKKEATLMTEIAILHNVIGGELPEFFKPHERYIKEVFQHYENYLKSDNREQFFSQSDHGILAINVIENIKLLVTDTKKRPYELNSNPIEQAKSALGIMMANNLHYQHGYAKVIQTLSIFVERASIAGCKSGNERSQAIAGRVSILDNAARNPQDPIMEALRTLAQSGPNEVMKTASSFKQTLDKKYDLNLQSAISLISDVDQGAAAKVNAKRGLAGLYNRNYAEESSLAHLHQNKADKMQAHKGLTKQMIQAVDGPQPMGFFAYMKSKMGALGVIAGIIGFPIALYFHNKYKKEEKTNFEQSINEAQYRQINPEENFVSSTVTMSQQLKEKTNFEQSINEAQYRQINPEENFVSSTVTMSQQLKMKGDGRLFTEKVVNDEVGSSTDLEQKSTAVLNTHKISDAERKDKGPTPEEPPSPPFGG